MKTARLKINTYTRSIARAGTSTLIDGGPLKVLLCVFAGLALCYVLVLGNIVWNIVERRSLEGEARALANDVSDLELEYLSLSSSIDASLGNLLGFIETRTEHFTTRKSLGRLAIAGNEL